MKHLNSFSYVSPEIYMLEMSLEDSACLMASNATESGFTFGDVTQDDTFKDTDWI